MQQTQWNTHQKKQYKLKIKQALLMDESTLSLFSQDFGKLKMSKPEAVISPQNVEQLQTTLKFAYENSLPVTIRGMGLSQSGQALSPDGGVILHLDKFSKILEKSENYIWVEANASWAKLLAKSIKDNMVPYVLPYNCNLSIGGVLSAGGIGASSFKYGPAVSHVAELEVILADGEIHKVDASSPLFHACLGGEGRFGVITKACIKLRPCKKNLRTFLLVYHDKESWLKDLEVFTEEADYLEVFCSPAIQGSKISAKGRLPFAEWLYSSHVSLEYEDSPPKLEQLGADLRPWKILHTQDESLVSFLHRHDGRFAAMQANGFWELAHPWYECFISREQMEYFLEEILINLPLNYVNVLQVLPIKKTSPTGLFMLPEALEVYALMILNPGLTKPALKDSLKTIEYLDKFFLKGGGKRYLSGFLGDNVTTDYWKSHFGQKYADWINLKNDYDKKAIFRSLLFDRHDSSKYIAAN